MTHRTVITMVLAVAAALVATASAAASGGPAPIPTIPGVAGLPGPVAPAYPAAASITTLATKPDTGPVGTNFTVTGTGLAPSSPVTLTWSTANVTWLLDGRPDSVDYVGRQATKLAVVLGTTQTDASGKFTATFAAPKDWGGIHDIYAVVGGQQVAKGGFLIERSVTISPKSGPIGTPITVTYSGLGSSLYEGAGAMYWDNHFTGAMPSVWTRGTATAHIRAAGPVGQHVVTVMDAVNFAYLNIQQSPVPWATGEYVMFTTTKDNGPPKASLSWPKNVAPTMTNTTTIDLSPVTATNTAKATLSSTKGPVNSKVDLKVTGLTPGQPVTLAMATVVGNRVNCSGTCWVYSSIPMGTATAAADGTLSTQVTIPDGLGGWHVVEIQQGGQDVAVVNYYIDRSIVTADIPLKVKQGQHFTIHLKGFGWTQLDNTVALDYDNSYVGYACGFNSNGDVVANFVATGEPGTHIIDGYPLLYTQQPSYANTNYGMQPILTYADDFPGLALGYRLPAFRLAITVVK